MPKKVKLQKEWPLGKLNPFTACSKGSEGLSLLTRNLIRYSNPVLVTPMSIMYKKSFLSLIYKSKTTTAMYAGNKKLKDPKKVMNSMNFVTAGEVITLSLLKTRISREFSFSITISTNISRKTVIQARKKSIIMICLSDNFFIFSFTSCFIPLNLTRFRLLKIFFQI